MSAPYYSSKPKANEVWRFENSHCGGRSSGVKTHSDKVCLSSPFLWKISEKMKPCNSNPEIANAGAPQTTSTSSPSMCISLPASSSVSPWSPTTSYSRTSPGFPDSPRPYPLDIFLQGHMGADRNGKMSSGRTYNWHSNCLRWIDLLMQDHTFLRHSME